MKVWMTHRSAHIHLRPDCDSFASYRRKLPLREVELDTQRSPKWCKRCVPYVLWNYRPTHHALCQICGHKKLTPCRHNGGVAVLGSWYMGETRVIQTYWRWPENVMASTLANPATLV